MPAFIRLIEKRPVRFVLLVESVLALFLGFGVSLTTVQVGLIVGVVNAILAFTLDSFTTPVSATTGEPLSPNYRKVPNDAPDIFPAELAG